MEKTCRHCGKRFLPHPAVLNQHYCGSAGCQRARKRTWQKEKLKSDPDYRANQAAAQKAWRKKNSDYWKEYRTRNHEYREKNRLRQRERNRQRRLMAKMDEQPAKPAVAPGRYRLVPLSGTIAKMDALIVELGVVARECAAG